MTNFVIIDSSFDRNIILDLYAKFPDFEKDIHKNVDEEFHYNPYSVFGSFGGWLVNLILEGEKLGTIEQSFDFINDLCEQNAGDCNGILQVTFFEHLTDYKITIEAAQAKLRTIALKLFEEVLNGPIFQGGKSAN